MLSSLRAVHLGWPSPALVHLDGSLARLPPHGQTKVCNLGAHLIILLVISAKRQGTLQEDIVSLHMGSISQHTWFSRAERHQCIFKYKQLEKAEPKCCMMMQCMQCRRIISGLIAHLSDKDGEHAPSHPHLWKRDAMFSGCTGSVQA